MTVYSCRVSFKTLLLLVCCCYALRIVAIVVGIYPLRVNCSLLPGNIEYENIIKKNTNQAADVLVEDQLQPPLD